jgi:hypothetical protein
MRHGQRRVVHVVGENCLLVIGAEEIDTFIIFAAAERIGTVEDNIFRAGLDRGAFI